MCYRDGMDASHILDTLIIAPIPIIICIGAVITQQVAKSGGSFDNRAPLAKWLGSAVIIISTGLVCGLYTDGANLIRNGVPHDLLSCFTGTIVFVGFAVAGLPIFALLWGLDRIVRKVFNLPRSDKNWDIFNSL